MKTFLFTNIVSSRLLKLMGTQYEQFAFVNLDETKNGVAVSQYLRGISGAIELDRTTLYRERSDSFRDLYIEFMAGLNKVNSSTLWWGMSFTSKQPLGNPLCRNAFDLLLLMDLADEEYNFVVVITDSKDLVTQFKINCRLGGIKVVNDIVVSKNYRRFLLNHTPAGLLRVVCRTILLWILTRKLRDGLPRSSPYTLIATHTHIRSFLDNGNFEDVYFGPLITEADRSGRKTMVLALMYDHPVDQIRYIKNLQIPLSVMPLESLLNLKSLVLAILQACISYCVSLKVDGQLSIGGVNLGFLIKRSVRQSINSGEHFNNTKVRFVAKWLAQNTDPNLCIYPYEARSWEKMLITGLRSENRGIKIIGYQHTSFSLHHIHLTLGLDEHKITPLPDHVLTCGEITAKWLSEFGGYPENFISPACALRFAQRMPATKKEGFTQVRKILVVLGTSQHEYNATPAFVEQGLVQQDRDFEVRVRTHPSLSEFHFEETSVLAKSSGGLVEDLEWADVVVYSSSTVAMEAIYHGIPVIYVDNGDFLDTDPLLGFDGLKWTVKDPKALIPVFNEIAGLNKDLLQTLQQAGEEYVNRYLKPVTDTALEEFWSG